MRLRPWLVSLLLPLAGSLQAREELVHNYTPESARAGGEAKGMQMARIAGKLYLPESLAPGERVRGWYQYIFTQDADSFLFREFAERAKVVIGPEIPAPARKALAERLGVPELENIPVTYLGHSAGGRPAWAKGTHPDTRDRALAVIGHHAATFGEIFAGTRQAGPAVNEPYEHRVPDLQPDVKPGDPRGEVPVWNVGGARDRHQRITRQGFLASAAVTALGWKWTFALGVGESHQHHDFEATKLQLLWLEEVAALRVRGEIGADGSTALARIDETKGWIGYLELILPVWGDNGYSTFRVATAETYPYAAAPGRGALALENGRLGGYVWLPTERFARAWKAYHLTGSIRGDATTRLQTQIWFPLTDTVDARLGWGLFQNTWARSYFSALNLPDFKGDMENVTWEPVAGLPDWLLLSPDGRMMTKAPQAGTYRFRLRAKYGAGAWEADYHLGVRNGEDDSTLAFALEKPPKGARIAGPLAVAWTSSLPLGLLQWHSSRDGELGTNFGELGERGKIVLDQLTPGSHLITVLAYSAAPQTQRQAVSFLIDVPEKR